MLTNIFASDELPNFKIYEVAHKVVSDYMEKKRCKIDLVASELETTTGVLYRQLNPKDTQMPLSIDRIIAITKLTNDKRIIEGINKEFDLVSVPIVKENSTISNINILVDIANIENNDVFKIIKKVLEDDKITIAEKEEVLKDIYEAEKAIAMLKDSVLHTTTKDS